MKTQIHGRKPDTITEIDSPTRPPEQSILGKMAEDYANTAGLHKSEISPLPWLDTDRNDNPQTMDPYIKIDNEHSGIAYVFGDTKAEREANATYIVKAVNEYPNVVEALRWLLGDDTSDEPSVVNAREILAKCEAAK